MREKDARDFPYFPTSQQHKTARQGWAQGLWTVGIERLCSQDYYSAINTVVNTDKQFIWHDVIGKKAVFSEIVMMSFGTECFFFEKMSVAKNKNIKQISKRAYYYIQIPLKQYNIIEMIKFLTLHFIVIFVSVFSFRAFENIFVRVIEQCIIYQLLFSLSNELKIESGFQFCWHCCSSLLNCHCLHDDGQRLSV